jgi:hypothetical protein
VSPASGRTAGAVLAPLPALGVGCRIGSGDEGLDPGAFLAGRVPPEPVPGSGPVVRAAAA